MKNKRYNKLIWALIAVGVISGGILIFNSETTDLLEPEKRQPSVVAEKVESSELSKNSELIALIEKFKGSDNEQNSEINALIKELKTTDITQDPEIRAKLEVVKGLHNLLEDFKELEKHGLPPGAVTVGKPRSQPFRIQYMSDESAAELGLSSPQVAEFQKIFNYYRQRLDQHITDNATIEVLGEKHHRIKVPKMESSSEIRDAVGQELRLLLGDQKYDDFSKLDEGRIHDFFDLYGEYPRTIEIKLIEGDPYGGDWIDIEDITHFTWYSTIWGGRLNSRQFNSHKVFTDLIASHN